MPFEGLDRDSYGDDPEEPDSGWGCIFSDCTNENTTEWEYTGYVAANDENNGLDKTQVANTNGNSWVMAGYFEDKPNIVDEDAGNCQYGNYFSIALEEAEFRVTYPSASSEQTTLKTAGHNPDDNDADSKITFGVSLGGIGVDLSAAAFYPSVDLTTDSYEETSWTFDYGVTGETNLPTGYDDSIGVRWDFEGQDPRQINVEFNHDVLFETTKHCSGPETIYTALPELTFTELVQVVPSPY